MDGLYMTISLHCVTKLQAYGRLASKLFDNTENSSKIDELVRKHLKLVNLIEMANSSFDCAMFCQLISTLGLFVTVSFQLNYGLDYCVTLVFVLVMAQLFIYCFLSECIYTTVSPKFSSKTDLDS